MWSTLESMFVLMAITVLKSVIKNPKSVAKEASTVLAIAQAATEADMAVSGSVWTYAAPPTVPAA
jgi:hypothetical protein